MLRALACGCLCWGALQAASLPAWWLALPGVPRLESAFLQESDSAVFGKLKRAGTLKLAQGGRLRVEYRKGMLLVADGRTLVQYDPQARTAQRMNLRRAAADAPLLNILLNPGSLGDSYQAQAGPGPQAVTLTARKPGLPTVVLEGQGAYLKRVRWTDATGAKQVLELVDPKVPAAQEGALFSFQAPTGTRWLD